MEMAITDKDVNVGVMEADGSADDVRNYLEVARVLQNRLGNLIAGTGDESPELRRILAIAVQDLKRVAVEEEQCTTNTCRHVCSKHKELTNPSLWGTLPHEVLELVFAHLPPPAISRLRCLSKHWKETLATVHSDFYRVCEEVCPKMFALITRDTDNLFWVRVFNTKSNRWYTDKIAVGCYAADWTSYMGWDRSKKWLPNMMPRMTAVCAGGGLVCFVTSLYLHSKRKKTRPSLYINVVNPLTGRSHELPPLLELCDMRMMQIKVDPYTKGYKILVLGESKADGTDARVAVQVYDSVTEEWIATVEPLEDLVLGTGWHLRGRFENSSLSSGGPYAYDFQSGRSIDLGVNFMNCSALYNDRLFVLRMDANGPANESTADQSPLYYIEEFQVQMRATTWAKVKVGAHRCNPFEHPPKVEKYSFRLYACGGFLMAFTGLDTFGCHGRFVKELGWLYNLSTGNWCDLDLPQLPVGRRTYEDCSTFRVELPGGQILITNHDSTYNVALMCDVHWDA